MGQTELETAYLDQVAELFRELIVRFVLKCYFKLHI